MRIFLATTAAWALNACSGVPVDPATFGAAGEPAAELNAADVQLVAARVGEARALYLAGDLDAADQTLDEILEMQPAEPRALALRGAVLSRRAEVDTPPEIDEWRMGEGYLRRATRMEPHDVLVAWLHADFLRRDGHLEAAAERAERTLRVVDDDDLLRLAAEVRYENGQEAMAAAWFERIVDRDPRDFDSWYRLGQCRARAALTELQNAPRVERQRAAMAAFTRCTELRPAELDGWHGVIHLGLDLHRETNDPSIEDLLAACGRADAVSTGSPLPAFLTALVHEAAEDREAAIASYRLALAVDPRHAGAVLNLARLLSEGEAGGAVATEDLAEARALLTRALELDISEDERRRITEFLSEGSGPQTPMIE